MSRGRRIQTCRMILSCHLGCRRRPRSRTTERLCRTSFCTSSRRSCQECARHSRLEYPMVHRTQAWRKTFRLQDSKRVARTGTTTSGPLSMPGLDCKVDLTALVTMLMPVTSSQPGVTSAILLLRDLCQRPSKYVIAPAFATIGLLLTRL